MELEEQIKNIIINLPIYEDISMAFLFGSRARGDYTENSDIDIAIMINNELGTDFNLLELRSELVGTFSSGLGKKCDVILINQASLLLKYQIIKYGVLLYIAEDEDYSSFFSKTLKEYFDFKYYQDMHYNKMLNRLKKVGKNDG